MPGPTLTPEEIAQVQKEAAKQQGFSDALTAAAPAKAARAAELGVADGAFKKFFDYYNDDIIAKYDAERKAIIGDYIAAPITEADIEGPAHINGAVRTTPSLPATDIIRVPQFDGLPIVHTAVNETQHIADQIPWEDKLVNGYSPQPTVNVTTKSDTALTSGSTTLNIKDVTASFTIANGDYFIVHDDTGTSALVLVTNAVPGVGGPPYTSVLTITVVIPPVGTLASGSKVIKFTGFTNVERTAKLPTIVALQNIMDFLIAKLQLELNNRVARINEELTALAANQDPDGVAQITTATTAANTSKTFITNYLVTTVISDTGLGTLVTERGVRSPFLVTRVAQIIANYTGQTKNYYNERYNVANNRGNTSRGSLRLQFATADSASTLTSYAASSQAAADAFTGLLGP